jgi:two-component system nitrate/nitrite response regulator NarL
MSKKIRVVILEDHQSIIDGYLFRLGGNEQIEVAAIVRFGDQLEPALKQHPADVVLLDISVPTSPDNSNPYPILHLIPGLLEADPGLHALVVSMFAERGIIHAVMDSGASGYVLKDDQESIQELDKIIMAIARGDIYFSQKIEQLIDPKNIADTLALTKRQKEILSLCAAYPDSKTMELGEKMGVTHSTVRNLLSTAYLRLKVRTRAAAISKARKLGLITPDDPVSPS